MKILGIETSCDETAAAVVENGRKILSNVLASSSSIQSKSGGIIPEIAAREHVTSILPVIKQALFQALLADKNTNFEDIDDAKLVAWARRNIDAIAVTAGPGLIGCLLVGVETAKALSYAWTKPIIPVVHTLAHLYSNWLVKKSPPKMPAVVLTVSGGHTDLLLMKNHGKFQILGSTRDDTAGEAFDKIARSLGLPFPGGPQIQKLAKSGDLKTLVLPRPLLNSNDLDFSFSGLKTAAIREIKTGRYKNDDLAASVQDAICDVLVRKTLRAVEKFKARTVLLAGGVAANTYLRDLLIKKSPVLVEVPPINLCTDNATFVASYAYFNYHPITWKKINAESDTFSTLEKYAMVETTKSKVR
ncbi:MAG: tRNA (adenosine(37)-N6)-threonylcarbamoyltransferase complex transferase subunit TsaD [Candidatus Woykebacteria bacterium RIFCSPLOWO2_01_FULL_41_12]|uniref:tRNA N6-adenosine threonylcarbamoyltransferase n=1 Tax=Candidatus Woykebacteria bacterium RIFCSPLOWO2_01_FULL_41_12 TaxID=1802604 RepID=A0A1G1WVG0_9BACT|nr:MAG: tRNA (adenosine(37)-N6)-threonylcarbamoyltransferase complex transferase subunit TsaD [Candidatus Woykebacteria bacterium RIFCSPLOWO2_01_FULL_41_12]